MTSAVPDGSGLAVTLSVSNRGSSSGQTTCRISDPADRTGNLGGFVLTPQIGAGQSVTFMEHLTAIGSAVRPLAVDCKSP